MATSGGPNMVKDNLVFGYDTGYPVLSGSSDTYRFNKGEPTVNIRAGSGLDGSYSTSGRAIDNSGTLIAPDATIGWSSITSIGDQNAGYRIAKFPYNSVTSDVAYTFSLELYNPGPDSLEIFIDGNTGYTGITIPLGYSRWSYTITPNANKTQAIFFGTENKTNNVSYSPPRVIFFKNYQVEAKDHVTPFVNGTRSISSSLLDLKRTTDIDLSNVSFNSNAQMIFDGTDDRIELGDQFDIADYFIDNQSFTIEAVVNLLTTDTNSNGGIFSNQKYQSQTDAPGFGLCIRRANNTLYYCMNIVEVDNSIQTSYEALAQVAANIGNLEHVTYVYDNNTSTIYAYINGELANSQTNSNFNWSLPTDTTRTKIGTSTQGGWGYYHEMNLPVIKCYNKALTSAEVQQNYNAYKNRFNL